MAGSTWQQYYDPQIAARNRWAEQSYAGRHDLPPRSGRASLAAVRERRVGIRARLGAAAVAAGSAAIATLGVVGLHLYRAEPQSVEAPAAPAAHPAQVAAPGPAIGE
jgi:hypothetical protein